MRAAPLPLLAQVVRTLRLTVLRIVAASTLSMSGFYVLFVWLPSHLRATAQIEWALELNVGVMTLWAVCVVSAGYVADSFRSAACCRRLPVHCLARHCVARCGKLQAGGELHRDCGPGGHAF